MLYQEEEEHLNSIDQSNIIVKEFNTAFWAYLVQDVKRSQE